jgi:hypothetical protein
MTETAPAEPKPPIETVEVIADEIASQLDNQFEQTEAITRRAQQLLVFGAGILALVVGLQPPSRDVHMVSLFVGALAILVAVMLVGFLAWRTKQYRRDPDPRGLWERHRFKTTEQLRHQLVHNWIQCFEENRKTINRRLGYLKATQVLLGVEVVYVVAMVIAKPYIE